MEEDLESKNTKQTANEYYKHADSHRTSFVYAVSCAVGSTLIFLVMIFLKYFYRDEHHQAENVQLRFI